jgi:NADPH-dependent curcumin reductase CurA
MSTVSYSNRQWIYRARPSGPVGSEHYELVTTVATAPSDGEALIGARYLSVDPYMRIQQAARRTWETPHQLGVVQGGAVVGQVLALGSPAGALRIGDWVVAYTGWQELGRCHISQLTKLDPEAAPVRTALGALGMPGRTAWFGLMEAGRPRPGDVLVVSGAAGAVGSLVVQFGKRAGCRVVGIAGGPEKCRIVREQLGADVALDYRLRDPAGLAADLERATGGIDVYFDNVGGTITDAVLPLINLRGRVVICGQVSQYDGALDEPGLGPRFLHHLLFQRATIQGVLARDYAHRADEYTRIAAPWVRDGSLVVKETIVDGFDRLPWALSEMLRGGNVGKMLVRCVPPPPLA